MIKLTAQQIFDKLLDEEKILSANGQIRFRRCGYYRQTKRCCRQHHSGMARRMVEKKGN
ncbi:TPA: NgoBV family restriction endonuclease [Neisseria gonorrhoeae]